MLVQPQQADLLVKYRITVPARIDFPIVKDFLRALARNSRNTPATYRDALSAYDKFFQSRYPGLDLVRSLSILLQAQRGVHRIEGEYSLLPWGDIYKLLDQFMGYMQDYGYKNSLCPVWMAAIKRFYGYGDVEISDVKFKNRVTIPKDRKEDAVPLEQAQVRQILQGITNLRLKAYCTAEACIGPRPVENAAVRYQDVAWAQDWPAVYMRAEYSKNKLPRTIYWSPEAKDLAWKFKVQKYGFNKPPADALVFGFEQDTTPHGIYDRLSENFRDHLDKIGFEKRVPGLSKRHEITLYSFRRYAETTIEDHTSANFADYILGHKKSPYYVKSEEARRRIFMDKCAEHLVFFDFAAIERRAQEAELEATRTARALEEAMVYRNEYTNLARRTEDLQKRLDDLEGKSGKKQAAPGGRRSRRKACPS